MSASLVGSEMCIRDSVSTRPLWSSSLALQTQPRTAERNAYISVMGASGSVSYTHLTLPTICSV
eukprot:2936666-Alexandrium_andersonii.AAC.1